jgi:hypothetical protein
MSTERRHLADIVSENKREPRRSLRSAYLVGGLVLRFLVVVALHVHFAT